MSPRTTLGSVEINSIDYYVTWCMCKIFRCQTHLFKWIHRQLQIKQLGVGFQSNRIQLIASFCHTLWVRHVKGHKDFCSKKQTPKTSILCNFLQIYATTISTYQQIVRMIFSWTELRLWIVPLFFRDWSWKPPLGPRPWILDHLRQILK